MTEERIELDDKRERLDKLEIDYFSASNELASLKELYQRVNVDYADSVKSVSLIQKSKLQFEQDFHNEQVKNRNQLKELEDKDRVIEKYKKDNEKLCHRLSQLEIQYDNLEVIKAAAS